jgi:hypothetical protein
MEKLLLIQSKLKAPKGQYNSFGKYKYRNVEDIMEAVKPLLLKHKCTIILSDELVNIWDRYYVKAIARLMDIETKEIVETSGYAREEETKKGMDWSQITWASSSYARKYALNWLLAIDDTKDSDWTNTHWKDEKKEVFDIIRFEKMKERAKTESKELIMQRILKVKKDYEIMEDVKTELDLFLSQLK